MKWRWSSKYHAKYTYYLISFICKYQSIFYLSFTRIFTGKKKNSDVSTEEEKIRKAEDKLFDKLKKPPSLLKGVMDILGDASKSKAVAEQRANDKKRRIEREDRKSTALKDAFEGREEKRVRKRGRKKKGNS